MAYISLMINLVLDFLKMHVQTLENGLTEIIAENIERVSLKFQTLFIYLIKFSNHQNINLKNTIKKA